MTHTRPQVLITGAAGRVGRILTKAWRDTYSLTLVDVQPIRERFGTHAVIADVRDAAAMRTLCKDKDTVIDLAIEGYLGARPEQITPVNRLGAQNVMRAAASAGCRRLVYASSLAIDRFPERDYSRAKLEMESWARALSETTPLSIHCLRLGRVLSPWHRAVWPGHESLDFVLTHRDLIEFFNCSVNAPAALHFGVFNGISANQPGSHDISATREQLGYVPRDDAHELARRRYRDPIGLMRRMKSGLRKLWA